MKRTLAVLSAFFLLISMTACVKTEEPQQPAEVPVYEKTIFAMDTVMTFKVYGEGTESVLDECEALVRQVEDEISKTIEASDIYRLNGSNGQPTEVAPETAALLTAACEYSQRTGGAFDITVEPLVALWNIGGGRTVPPEQAEIDALMDMIDYRRITVDGDTVTLNGCRIDLGAIGKGYVSDRLDALLRSHDNVSGALFSLGGNVGVVGTKPEDKPFVIGVRDPLGQPSDFLGYVELTDMFVVSSGDYERFFEYDGVVYHHIIDPATGAPSRSDIKEVSIVCESGAYADALSTALFVMGTEKALQFYEENKDFEAIFVTQDAKVFVTQGLKDKFTFTGANAGYTYE
ncbi:MAG TPA: FAD:protein FMN transferase [Candidatus Acidoferrum sp.]|nr:FAD:protein FMN transferase [Candidatus Acidoferrum sp.]